jgi:hypothetical protein
MVGAGLARSGPLGDRPVARRAARTPAGAAPRTRTRTRSKLTAETGRWQAEAGASHSARAALATAGRWAVVLAGLAAVLAVELALLRGPITRDLNMLAAAGRPASSASPAATVPAPPVPRLVPANAGAVAGVDVRALGSCAPGATCQVRVLVRLHPQPQPVRVEWTFQVIDRCTGSVRNTAGGKVTVEPGGQGVAAVDTVTLPTQRALAVTAATSVPATAASAPLLVPARASC